MSTHYCVRRIRLYSGPMRSVRLDLRVTPQEREQLAELAQLEGVSMSDVVRMLFKRAHADRVRLLHEAPRPRM